MKIKSTAVILGLAGAAMLSCMVSAEEAKRIAYTTMALSSPYFTEVSQGIQKGCEERGWECTIQESKVQTMIQFSDCLAA